MLLAAPFNSEKNGGHWRNFTLSLHSSCQKLTTGQVNWIASTANGMLSKLDKEDTKYYDSWTCQDKEGQSYRISRITEKSISCISPIGWIWIPQHCRGTLCHCPGRQVFLKDFGSLLLALSVYPGNIIFFLCLWWRWRLYSYTYGCSCYQIQKKLI